MKRLLFGLFAFLIGVAGTGAAGACTSSEIDVLGDGTQCEISKFQLTTTNLGANGSFNFWTSAKGTFYVDCGDGGTLSGTGASGKTITKSTNVNVQYTCSWSSAGAHTINFGGVATEYSSFGLDVSTTNAAINFGLSGNQEKIASISGSLSAIFPELGTGSGQVPHFNSTFANASNLTSIPNTLFSGLTGSSSNAKYMFYSTFSDCTGLTSIPEGLFKDIIGAANSMFSKTFEDCTNLTGYIAPTTFAGLTANGAPGATSMWYNTFDGTQLATTCPNGLPQYTTGYEGNANSTTWNGKVSCGCMPGYHLDGGVCVACSGKPANSSYVYDSTAIACPWECVTGYSLHENLCLAHYDDVCPGDQFYEITLDACTACPSGYTYNTNPGKRSVTECQISCPAGSYALGYTQLDYIETTGTQYIDTGAIVSQLVSPIVEITLQYTSLSEHAQNSAESDRAWFKMGIYRGKFSCQAGRSSKHIFFSDADTQKHTLTLNTANSTCTLDNTTKSLEVAMLNTIDRSLFIAAQNTGSGTPYAPSIAKYYSYKIYSNNVLIRDMIPARRDSDGVLGMYDLATNTFYTNAGTGTFIAGSDVRGICINVGAGYYSTGETVNYGSAGTRTACPAGLTTVGYGHGADSANDCARTLHIGDKVLYGRRDKVTNPSLNIKLPNEDTYYVSLSPSDHTISRLHLSFNGNEYTAYDDSLFYGERNFDTNAHVTQ